MNKIRVGVIGTGAFGIALSKLAYSNNCDVLAWTKFENEKRLIETIGENSQVLPGVEIEKEIRITTSLEEVVHFSDLIILVIPVAFLSSILFELSKFDLSNKHFCIASKGIEEKDNLMLHELFDKYIISNNLALISGPSFAIDIVEEKPVGLSIASRNDETYRLVRMCLVNNHFALEKCNDMMGIELCGTIKNVIALASGMLGGLMVTDSTKAFFMTKALKEMANILEMLGGMKETAYTLAGMGDLILTCSSTKSRNYTFGYLLAQNRLDARKFLENNTVEGVHALNSLMVLINKTGMENKLISLINEIVSNNCDAKLILDYLSEGNN